MSDHRIRKAIQKGWDTMSPTYQRDSVISTDDVHYGPLLPGECDLHLLGDVKDKRVLELASGAAQNSIALSKLGAKTVAIDVSPVQQEAARTHLEDEGVTVDLVLNDAQKLCFTNNVFDLIVSSNGMEFIPDLESCLNECYRVLCPDGLFVMSTVHPLSAFAWNDSLQALQIHDYFNPPVELWEDVQPYNGQYGLTLFRSISETFTTLVSVGFRVDKILELPAMPIHDMSPDDHKRIPYRGKDWEHRYFEMSKVPFNVIYVAIKES